MVSHNHLSAGNSVSSPSVDLFAEFGVSRPSSPASLPTPVGVEDMGESDPFLGNTGTIISSDDSTSNALQSEMDIGCVMGANAKEIFSAAQHFSHKDREEALFERKKNMHLMSFLTAHGVTTNDVQEFLSDGKRVNLQFAHKVSTLKEPSGSSPGATLGATLQQVKCVGEDVGLGNVAPLNPPATEAGKASGTPMPVVQARIPISSCPVNSGPPVSALPTNSKAPASFLEEGEIPAQGEKVASKSWCDVVGKTTVRASRQLTYHPLLLKLESCLSYLLTTCSKEATRSGQLV